MTSETDKIMDFLSDAPATASQIMELSGAERRWVYEHLMTLSASGLVVYERGQYRLKRTLDKEHPQ